MFLCIRWPWWLLKPEPGGSGVDGVDGVIRPELADCKWRCFFVAEVARRIVRPLTWGNALDASAGVRPFARCLSKFNLCSQLPVATSATRSFALFATVVSAFTAAVTDLTRGSDLHQLSTTLTRFLPNCTCARARSINFWSLRRIAEFRWDSALCKPCFGFGFRGLPTWGKKKWLFWQ